MTEGKTVIIPDSYQLPTNPQEVLSFIDAVHAKGIHNIEFLSLKEKTSDISHIAFKDQDDIELCRGKIGQWINFFPDGKITVTDTRAEETVL